MIRGENIKKILIRSFFFRWHPEVALRYLPIVKLIKNNNKIKTILEVGSGGLGIAPYTDREVTGIDKEFKPPYHPRLNRVKASAVKLPFTDSSFDIVLSADMIEHIAPQARRKVIAEMIRVAKQLVVVGVPCGAAAHQQDMELDKILRIKYRKRYKFFDEQISMGLPDKDEIRKLLRRAALKYKKTIKLQILDNENLKLHKFLMWGWMSDNFMINVFFRKILLLALPLFKLMNNPPVYRQIFVCEIL